MIHRRKIYAFLILILSLFTLSSLYAQTPGSGYVNGNNAGAPIMSDQFRLNMSNSKQEDVEFFKLAYRSHVLDLRALKSYTGYEIPESVEINPPDLTAFDHTIVLIGIYGGQKEPEMIIWLAGNYLRNNISFFLDYDQDRNFNDDQGPVLVKRGAPPRDVTLHLPNGDKTLSLGVPKKSLQLAKQKERIDNKLAVNLNAGVGSGTLEYNYTNNGYRVNISEKNIGAALAYYSFRFTVGVSTSFQNHYYYASYFFLNGQRTTNVNRDKHPSNKLQSGFFGSYRILLSRTVEIQPIVKYGIVQYLNPEYKPSRFEDTAYRLDPTTFYEVGVRAEFTVGIKKAFYLEFAHNNQNWEPQGLVPPGTDFTSDMAITKFGVGYVFAL